MAYEREHMLVSERAQRVRDRIRAICADLPEAAEKVDGFGHTVFHVRDKSFVFLSEGEQADGGRLTIRSDKETQQLLIDKGPYIRAPYIGQHGWVFARADEIVDWAEFDGLVVEGYLRAAPKKLMQAYRDNH